MAVSYLVPITSYFIFDQNIFILLPLITVPLGIKLIKMIYTLKGTELNKTLELTAKFSALFGFLFAIGIIV